MRGGCACAGTYGHYLLNVSHDDSHRITELINQGDLSLKPGWIRLSLHPTMTTKELMITVEALRQIQAHYPEWKKDYVYNNHTNEFRHRSETEEQPEFLKSWFDLA